MTYRKDFTKQTKRFALDRANGHCEGIGAMYGLPPGKRCNVVLHGKRKEYDHILACSNGGDNSLSNCAVICGTCHDFKSHKIDTPRAADNGATVTQLEAIFGWQGGGMAALYTRAADRKRAAIQAMRLLERDPMCQPGDEVGTAG